MHLTKLPFLPLLWLAIALCAMLSRLEAQDTARQVQSLVVFHTTGEVTIRNSEGEEQSVKALAEDVEQPAAGSLENVVVRSDELLITQPGASAQVLLPGGSSIVLEEDTEIRVPSPKRAEDVNQSLELLKGRLFLNIQCPEDARRTRVREFRLKTPTLLLAVKGTQFFADSRDGNEVVGVHEGQISVTTERNGRKIEAPLSANRVIEINADDGAKGRAMDDTEKQFADKYREFELKRRAMQPYADPFRGIQTWFVNASLKGQTLFSSEIAEDAGLEIAMIGSPTPGQARELRFRVSMNLSAAILHANVASGSIGTTRAAEFLIRGVGIRTVTFRRGAGGERTIIRIDVSSGDWTRVVFPLLDSNGLLAVEFYVSGLDSNLLPGHSEYVVQAAFGSII